MSTPDAPDWQRVVQTVQSTGAVPDAPDWERIVVGPGGAPVGGGGGGGSTGEPTPAAWGWLGWTYSPILSSTSTLFGNIRDVGLALFIAPSDLTVTSITWPCYQAGSGFVTDHNYVGIYLATTSGTSVTALDLVASSAAGAADSAWASQGSTPVDLSSAYKLTAGSVYYLAQLWDTGVNSNPRPYFLDYQWGTGGVFNNWPTAYVQTGNTTTSLPSSLSPSGLTVYNGAMCGGVA